MFYNCWLCKIKSQQISEANEVITISGKLGNGTVVDVEFVQFVGGDVTKMPITIDKTTSQQIVRVEINGTGTKELSSEFFGNSGQHLKYFVNCENNNVSVKASAFQNFTNLEILDLSYNMISSIPPDTFTRLDKLIRLELGQNQLSVVLHSWFRDLGNLELLVLYKNRLVEIPENAFDSLRKLKWLDLKDNYIEILRRNTFQKNEMLIGIYLQFNHIKEIQVGSFEHLSQLTELGLEGNNCINDTFDTETLLKIAEALSPCYPPVCRVPIILNGIIVRIDDNSTKLAGELFEGSGSVKVVCDPTFTKFHDKANQTTNKCVKDNWEDLQWPTCQSEYKFFEP